MAIDVHEFHHELFQEVHNLADAGGVFAEDAFFDVCTTMVMDAGDLETADRVHYVGPRGLRVDGYGGDPLEADGVLNLIVADFNQNSDVATLTATRMEENFRRVGNFLARSLDDRFRNSLEESAPAFGLADLISARWRRVSKLRLLLISKQNAERSRRRPRGRRISRNSGDVQCLGLGTLPPLRDVREGTRGNRSRHGAVRRSVGFVASSC